MDASRRSFLLAGAAAGAALGQSGTLSAGEIIDRIKAEFIKKNDMAIFRFHDHWHAHRPDGIATGMIEELGWTKNIDAQNPRLIRFDNITLSDLAHQMQAKLKIRAMRVVGDPAL